MPAGPRRGASTSLDTNGKNGGSADWFRLKAAVRPSPDSRRDAENAEGKRENLCVLCVSARNVWKAASDKSWPLVIGYAHFVIPAKAGTQGGFMQPWIPAFAGMTKVGHGRSPPQSRCRLADRKSVG